MDSSRAFSFTFQDPNWPVKILIGGVVVLIGYVLGFIIGWIPVIGWIIAISPSILVQGYQLHLMRNVIAGSERPLPEWSNLSGMLKDGLYFLLISLGYFLPLIVIFIILSLVTGATTGPTNRDPSAAAAAAAAMFSSWSILCCLGTIYAFAVVLVLPAAYGEYLATNNLQAAFNIPRILAMVQSNLSQYFIVWLLTLATYLVIAPLGLIAVCIGLPFTTFLANVIAAHLWGQLYVNTRGTELSALPPNAPV